MHLIQRATLASVLISLALANISNSMGGPALAATPPDPRFGAVEAYASPDRAAEYGVGWDRMVIHWYDRQPNHSDEWNISSEEQDRVNRATADGREVVMLLMGTALWATDTGSVAGLPRGLYLPVDDPNNLWAVFVRRMVSDYAGRVNHWIIWNEPDIAPEDYGTQFLGSVEDYYQLLKVAYLAAKQANPKAVIHLAGVTHWHDIVFGRPLYLERLFKVIVKDPTARRNNYYFDVATLHIYFKTETVFDLLRGYRNLLARYGLRKALWLNETNAAPMDDPQHPWNGMFALTMDQQAAFIIQANALALAAGAERIAIYKFNDITAPAPGADSYGLFRNDGSARPAAEAFRMVTTHFAGTRTVTYSSAASYYNIRLDRGYAVTHVVWARTDKPATVYVRASTRVASVMLYNHLGQAQPIAAKNGYYTLVLPAAQCIDPNNGCIIGGAPWLIVETKKK